MTPLQRRRWAAAKAQARRCARAQGQDKRPPRSATQRFFQRVREALTA